MRKLLILLFMLSLTSVTWAADVVWYQKSLDNTPTVTDRLLSWDGSATRNVLASDLLALRGANTLEFIYADVTAVTTNESYIRIPSASSWTNAYSWCDGAEAVLEYTLYYTATLGGAFGPLGVIAHDSAAVTDTVDISAFTDPVTGGWVYLEITTAGTTASQCTLALELEN